VQGTFPLWNAKLRLPIADTKAKFNITIRLGQHISWPLARKTHRIFNILLGVSFLKRLSGKHASDICYFCGLRFCYSSVVSIPLAANADYRCKENNYRDLDPFLCSLIQLCDQTSMSGNSPIPFHQSRGKTIAPVMVYQNS
jgi:hypothetical protein